MTALYAIKLIWCDDPTIIEGDTKPSYEMQWHMDDFFMIRERADAKAKLIEQAYRDTPSFVAALVCELVEKEP